MRFNSKDKVDAINAHIDVLAGSGEFEDIAMESTAELKTKANESTNNQRIIVPMNVLN